MVKLPRLSEHELIKILAKFGFYKVRQKGSYVMLIKETKQGKIGCVIPLHDELETGTLLGILRQVKISKEEFFEEYNK
ncbi:MAG: type II toxin-antitoxin system HicA family toxin [Thermoplasmata archaeon]|nr:type II toxin-antitoxin system HicA family toxin [Thermoplasmata archaeon]MBE3136550.1 type II toxin-antitoxin system HicA family toxin [Thermoplasmata archaeon]